MLNKKTLMLVILTAIVMPVVVAAQGRIIPPPHIVPPVHMAAFSVKSMYIDVEIDRQVASTTIEQVFHNEADRILEGTYLFPIPERASISKFTMWMNGEEVEGEVVEAKKARQIYEDIVRRLRDPGLLEYIGRDLFRARVFPIPARGDIKIRIVYEEILEYDAGLVEYRHPLKVDGNRVNTVGQVSMSVDIRSDVPVKSVYSPSHDIDTKIDGRTASCGFELEDEALDRDFVMYYTVSPEDVGLNLLTHRTAGDDGYFMMLVSPGRLDDPSKVIAKDIVFVVDKSGSMKGEKIEQARGALTYCINSLNGEDRFNIVLFSTNVTTYSDRMVRADRQAKKKATEFVDGITARGGTDINEALTTALESLESDRPRMVIFLTDGLPTVGETDVEAILSNLQRRDDEIRIFPFGVGYDVNTTLLDRVGIDHGGAVDYIRPEEDIEVKVSRFFDKVSNPVLSDVELDVRGVELVDVYPGRLPDLFDGTQLVVLGRYRDSGSKSILLRGRVGGRQREFDYEGTFERENDGHAFIARIWANRKIAFLLSEIRLHGADRELVDEVIELSLEHGIITPYTSYLILEEGSGEDRDRLSRVQPQRPADVPASAAKEAEEKVSALTLADNVGDAFGRGAVGLSKDLAQGKKKDNVVMDEETGLVRYAGGKRFLLRGEEWVDEDVSDELEVDEICFLSDEYFELLREHPELKDYLALGEKVTFVFNNRAYRIISEED